MANLQLANKCNLFSYDFVDKIKKLCQKLKELYQNPFIIWQKTQAFKKKLKGMRPCWAYWTSKKCTKNKPDIVVSKKLKE